LIAPEHCKRQIEWSPDQGTVARPWCTRPLCSCLMPVGSYVNRCPSVQPSQTCEQRLSELRVACCGAALCRYLVGLRQHGRHADSWRSAGDDGLHQSSSLQSAARSNREGAFAHCFTWRSRIWTEPSWNATHTWLPAAVMQVTFEDSVNALRH
jgi:hypothetical protein